MWIVIQNIVCACVDTAGFSDFEINFSLFVLVNAHSFQQMVLIARGKKREEKRKNNTTFFCLLQNPVYVLLLINNYLDVIFRIHHHAIASVTMSYTTSHNKM